MRQTAAERRIPAATYRLQFHPGFTFRAAAALTDYLHTLGVSDVYASPIFAARPGSLHGYDVTDPTRLNPELGSADDFASLALALRRREMGLILDIVPNHMGINDPTDAWWWDVLENGPSSVYAPYFDIEWQPVKDELENRVLLPVLGDQYGVVLESGQLKLVYADGAFQIGYYEHRYPVAPRTYRQILESCLAKLEPAAGSEQDAAAVLELQSVITAVSHLPPRTETAPQRIAERVREKEVIKRRLGTLYTTVPAFQAALDATVEEFNGRPGDPRSMDALDALVEAQAYRLAFWRVAGEEINYRRFFDINELAAIRVEDPEVFAATHELALRLLVDGQAHGARIDHPDGLYDPTTYFSHLQTTFLHGKLRRRFPEMDSDLIDAAVQAWREEQAEASGRARAALPLYLVVEKILSESEPLPRTWMVHGTTGYDFLAAANQLMVDAAGRRAFDRIYRRFVEHGESLAEMTHKTKMLIMRESLNSEINALSHTLDRLGERNRHYRDFTLNGLRTALQEVIACLPVYRTYINAHTGGVSARDRRLIQTAVRRAKVRRPGIDDSLFDYIEDTLLLRNHSRFDAEDQAQLAVWVMRFQQLTGPVMAKGVEDTAFYRYYRLTSLNEVGNHPAVFGISADEFHKENGERLQYWPHTMLDTSTHDNKRSEDVRARIAVLSEMPDAWGKALTRWARINAAKRTALDDEGVAPDRNDEYLIYQTLLGAWPLNAGATLPATDAGAGQMEGWGLLQAPAAGEAWRTYRERMVSYVGKAAKEAKLHTSWTSPDAPYEEGLSGFVQAILQPGTRNRFLPLFAPLAQTVAFFGLFNALSQVLLKLTSPGVPDIYQGNEVWNFSLVDPDNRRDVDYAQRRALLDGLRKRSGRGRAKLARELLACLPDGRIKLYITHITLGFRRDRPTLFAQGDYLPLSAEGDKATHVCAFARQTAEVAALVVTPRLSYRLAGGTLRPPVGAEVWADTSLRLPAGLNAAHYRNLYTGALLTPVEREGSLRLRLADVLADFPVALLTPVEMPDE
ncbi:MAG: malto-oligosyltrehalose synthase [Caldilineaceae bacterium]|nr:malto-oligosyltrehalose synthase [Caldilineaceae bacterium]